MPSAGDASPGAAWGPRAVLAAAGELQPWLVEVRRDLHRHPELGLEEHRTASRVEELLAEAGVDDVRRVAGTGVVARVGDVAAGPAVALRADLDALPLDDGKDVAWRSRVPGQMHACGHDVHTTILLGAARLLASRAAELPGSVTLLFQPAEETVGGAKLLIEAGALDQPPVRAIFGLHVDPLIDVGRIGVRYGQRNASSDDLRITLHGRSAHGAYPATGVDAIVVAGHLITALQAVVSRNVDARDSAVVTLGTIQGGTQANIVASRVQLTGTVRCLDQAVRERVLSRIAETVHGVAAAFGARAEVALESSYDVLLNDDACVDLVRRTAAGLLGEERVEVLPRPNMGVEDFAFYLARVPGAFYSLGVRNEEAGIVHPIHHELFDVDESCLPLGVALQVLNAAAALRAADGAGGC